MENDFGPFCWFVPLEQIIRTWGHDRLAWSLIRAKMDSYEQRDLILCIEGLGVVVKLESEDGSETVPVFQLGPDALGM